MYLTRPVRPGACPGSTVSAVVLMGKRLLSLSAACAPSAYFHHLIHSLQGALTVLLGKCSTPRARARGAAGAGPTLLGVGKGWAACSGEGDGEAWAVPEVLAPSGVPVVSCPVAVRCLASPSRPLRSPV